MASSEEFEKIGHHAADHGIKVGSVSIDSKKMVARKDDIVTKMLLQMEALVQPNPLAVCI